MGRHILKFLRQKRNLDFFNPHTKRQLELGLSLMEGQDLNLENAVNQIVDIANYCLDQQDDWKSYYKNFMDSTESLDELSRKHKLEIANLERESINLFVQEKYKEALNKAYEIKVDETNPMERAWYFQMYANLIYPKDKNASNDYLT